MYKSMVLKIIYFPIRIIIKIIRVTRNWYFTKRYVNQGKGHIYFLDPFLRINIKKSSDAIFELNGDLKISSWLNRKNPINIVLAQGSKFILNGDFTLGSGVLVSLSKNSELIIGGKDNESDSGITGDSKIMVRKKIVIGKDFICSWDVTITDSDWHQINGTEHTKPIFIDDHVWIGSNSCVLKGSHIGKGSIIASCSKIVNKRYTENVIIGGDKGAVIRDNISWQRDISV